MARTPSALPDSVRRGCVRQWPTGDVRDPDGGRSRGCGCRRVVHLVAGAPEGWADYERLYLDGTRHVAEACLAHGVEQLQFASSIAALYLGEPGAIVTNDTPPDDQLDERCDYAKAKILCERLLLDLHATRGLPVVIVRPGIVVGAGGPPEHLGVGHWASPTRCISWGTADHPLPFVLASDVAAAMVSALRSRRDLEGRAFNLAGDVTMRASEYVAALAALSRRDVRLHRRTWRRGGRSSTSAGPSRPWVARPTTPRSAGASSSTAPAPAGSIAVRPRGPAWSSEADRDRFIERGSARRSDHAREHPRLVHVFPAFSTGGPEVRTAVLINAMTEFAHTIVSLNGDVSGRSRLDAPRSVDFAPAAGSEASAGCARSAGHFARSGPTCSSPTAGAAPTRFSARDSRDFRHPCTSRTAFSPTRRAGRS